MLIHFENFISNRSAIMFAINDFNYKLLRDRITTKFKIINA